MVFTAEDRRKQDCIFELVNSMAGKINNLQDCLSKAIQVIHSQNRIINDSRMGLNLALFNTDANEQHMRKEAIRVRNVDDFEGLDPEQIIFEIAKEIEKKSSKNEEKVEINISSDHIERCHFIGGQAKASDGQPKGKKKLICKFGSYKMRMKFIKNKRIINSQTTGKFKNVFIAEDLTPLRSRLLWFIKDRYGHKFKHVHSINGIIKMKANIGTEEDIKNSKWINVSNISELFAQLDETDDFNLDDYNKGLRKSMQILPDIPIQTELDRFNFNPISQENSSFQYRNG